jgi:hypothetical protein
MALCVTVVQEINLGSWNPEPSVSGTTDVTTI